MKITVSACAKALLSTKFPEIVSLRLFYDLEGCSCGTDGTAALIKCSQIAESDEVIEAGGFRFVMNRSEVVYFEDEMVIDCSFGKRHSLMLKSPNGIITQTMMLYL